jgi:hypothetical protein
LDSKLADDSADGDFGYYEVVFLEGDTDYNLCRELGTDFFLNIFFVNKNAIEFFGGVFFYFSLNNFN